MAVRDLQDMGINLQKIVKRLNANQNLLKLLFYTDMDPLSKPDLAPVDISRHINEKLIKIVPRVGPYETSQSIVSLRIVQGITNTTNNEFQGYRMDIEVFVPLTNWFIKDQNLRPFAIMGEIKKSLCGKHIEGLGKISGGDFQINFQTEEMSCYEMNFWFDLYN